MRAGVFDSGIGGISVLKSLLDSKVFSEIIYYGDTARVPYGGKDKDTIIKYSLEAIEFFAPHCIDILIVACNTVSAYALEEMRKKAPYPIIGVIESGVLALQNTLHNKQDPILIIATQATIHSKAYLLSLKKLGYENIASIATPLLVPFVEEGILEGEFLQQCLHHYFKDLHTHPKAIILGCTHYPFIAKEIKKYFKEEVLLIHSGEAIVEYLQSKGIYDTHPCTQVQFFSSEDSEKLKKKGEELLKRLSI
ncbi:glutamate racemase [Helicobacter kayseriensis]|uniref:glutamate racemase n=1 Tax=Helicobacter kayseriensis TaxID=2905877 RepID=UPI001E32D630|nr:glutamate racemase [Helicobacter kayseriensis]MCE3046812.1 glutamate racemase [Helicobacter kayseriensis]MCE3047886.1 glutamate racemase [Helicobacter kayseriensis]